MSELVSYVKKIDAELEGALGALNQQEFASFLDAVVAAGKIASHGVGREGTSSILLMGSLYELTMFVFFEIVVLELLRRTGNSFGAARDRHTNLE